jgi:hypothetical protein
MRTASINSDILGAGSPSLSALVAGAVWTFMTRDDYERSQQALAAACGIRRQTERTEHRCALPGCEAMTRHNGGYCCADHCREHRQRQRPANSPLCVKAKVPLTGSKQPEKGTRQ